MQLVNEAPEFKNLYEEVYNICQNVERMMEMFSKELEILDRNTVRYMIDEMQDELDVKNKTIEEMDRLLKEREEEVQKLTEKLEKLSK